jgi:hypothetical protein
VVKDFHHVDPTEKAFNIGNSWRSHGILAIQAEIAKCVLVCANCHRRLEAGVLEVGDRDDDAS